MLTTKEHKNNFSALCMSPINNNNNNNETIETSVLLSSIILSNIIIIIIIILTKAQNVVTICININEMKM